MTDVCANKTTGGESIAEDQLNGLSKENDCLSEAGSLMKSKVSSEGLISQVIEQVVCENSVSIEEVTEEVNTSEDSVSILGRKRKHDDEIEIDANWSSNEVSLSPKRAPSSPERAIRDHKYCITASPRRMKRQMCDLVDKVESLQKKLKRSHQKSRRLKKKVNTLADVVSKLKEENLINNDCAAILETTFSGVPCELMKRLMTQKEKKNPGAYPPELRSFAMTLKFYSAKA